MAPAVFSIDVHGLPEVIWAVRRELARALRAQADEEASGYVRARLQEIAAAFEAGASEGAEET